MHCANGFPLLAWTLLVLLRGVCAHFLNWPNATTRHFALTLTWEKGAPDGYEREMFKVNGQFPGPALEVDEGDNVVVVVKNLSPYNTTLHYHGIEMLGTPWSDGMPGLTQAFIQPNCSFTYRWKATQHGSFFYHSHAGSQINDGLYGPITIHPAPDTPMPYSMITNDTVELDAIKEAEKVRVPMVLSDWRHIISEEDWDISQQSHIEHICFDSILINGKGKVNCLKPDEQTPLETVGQAGLLTLVDGAKLTDKSCLPPAVVAAAEKSPTGLPVNLDVIPHDIFYGCKPTTGARDVINIVKRQHESQKWVMLDLIATFGLHAVQVSLDELTMWVVAADGNDIEPVAVNSIRLDNGQRYTVLVKLEEPGQYTMRVSSTSDPQILFGTSILGFQQEGSPSPSSTAASTPWINERGVNTSSATVFFNESRIQPFNPHAPLPPQADSTYKMTMQIDGNSYLWAFNTTHRPISLDKAAPPLLFHPQPGLHDNHTVTASEGTKWVDFVIRVPPAQPPHPVHAHGRHYYVLGSGLGEFPWASVEDAVREKPDVLNLKNPPLRDTVSTPPAATEPSWLVIRRPADNPGVWLLHCHIMSHLQGGMSMVIQDDVGNIPEVPLEYREWDKCAM
ncbi:multicopper oxidase [Xylariomycetidae sp. FL0641]|nr:multicopper oxidase [Xylariomycetidae sp. FL0641]